MHAPVAESAPNVTRDRSVLTCASAETALGWIALSYTHGRTGPMLCRLVFGHGARESALARLARQHETRALGQPPAPQQVRRWMDLVSRFAEGQPVSFDDVPVDESHLTRFALRVTRACRGLAWGVTTSYGELATRIGRPKAARAVGGVMAANRTPLVVPCHRVIGAGGRLGGFSAPQGVAMKRRLLEMEQQPLYGAAGAMRRPARGIRAPN